MHRKLDQEYSYIITIWKYYDWGRWTKPHGTNHPRTKAPRDQCSVGPMSCDECPVGAMRLGRNPLCSSFFIFYLGILLDCTRVNDPPISGNYERISTKLSATNPLTRLMSIITGEVQILWSQTMSSTTWSWGPTG